MAGLKGNVAWVAAAKQTVKGTPITTYPYCWPLAGGSISPVRVVENLSETDASRDQGTAYVKNTGVEGSIEIYARDASLPFWGFAALGTTVPSGAVNFTHVQTPAAALNYYTVTKMIGNTLWEQYSDCKVNTFGISTAAGEPLTVSIGLQGRTSVRLASAPTVPAIDSGAVYNFNEATVTLGGSGSNLVSSFETTLENGLTMQQTDDFVPYDVVEGMRTATVGFDIIFETLDEYNKFHYGSNVGTATVGTLFETTAVFLFTKGVNNSVQLDYLHLAYEEFPIEPDPGGSPITASVRATSLRNVTDPVFKLTTKNQVATY